MTQQKLIVIIAAAAITSLVLGIVIGQRFFAPAAQDRAQQQRQMRVTQDRETRRQVEEAHARHRIELEQARERRERWERERKAGLAPEERELVFGDVDNRVDRPLSYFRGKLLVANFWSTMCVACISEMPLFSTLPEYFAGYPVVFISVSMDNAGQARVRRFLRQHDLIYRVNPIYMDTHRVLRNHIRPHELPVTMVFGPDGTLLQRIDVPVNWTSENSRRVIMQHMRRTGLIQ